MVTETSIRFNETPYKGGLLGWLRELKVCSPRITVTYNFKYVGHKTEIIFFRLLRYDSQYLY